MSQKLVKIKGVSKAKMLTPGQEYEVTKKVAENLIKKGEAVDPNAKAAAKAE